MHRRGRDLTGLAAAAEAAASCGSGVLCDVGGGGGAERIDCAVAGAPPRSLAEGGEEPFAFARLAERAERAREGRRAWWMAAAGAAGAVRIGRDLRWVPRRRRAR